MLFSTVTLSTLHLNRLHSRHIDNHIMLSVTAILGAYKASAITVVLELISVFNLFIPNNATVRY